MAILTSVVSMEFPCFAKYFEFVSCTSSSATLLMLTDASGDETGALNNVCKVGRNASSTSSWFVLKDTFNRHGLVKCFMICTLGPVSRKSQ